MHSKVLCKIKVVSLHLIKKEIQTSTENSCIQLFQNEESNFWEGLVLAVSLSSVGFSVVFSTMKALSKMLCLILFVVLFVLYCVPVM